MFALAFRGRECCIDTGRVRWDSRCGPFPFVATCVPSACALDLYMWIFRVRSAAASRRPDAACDLAWCSGRRVLLPKAGVTGVVAHGAAAYERCGSRLGLLGKLSKVGKDQELAAEAPRWRGA